MKHPSNIQTLCNGNVTIIDDSYDTALAIKALTDKDALNALMDLTFQRADEMMEYMNAKRT